MGGVYLLNEEEMRFIVNELFLGNRLAIGEVITPAGWRIDLRAIQSPIVVFASWGDNITPPQQALNWILDCYASDRDLLTRGQTIVYLLHEDIGHLGIFVSGRVAQREHAEIVEGLDVIETLPPGLWEMIIQDEHPGAPHADLVPGRYLVRFERRTLDDIRALEASREDEKPFAAVQRISEINEALYRTFVSPWVRPWVTETTAEALRQLHPNRMQYGLWSDRNPWMRGVAALAETVRQHRRPVASDNPCVAIERSLSERVEQALDGYREARDRGCERLFNAVYGSPWIQAVADLRGAGAERAAGGDRDETHEALIAERIPALRARMGEGGLREGIVRILLYAGGDDGAADTRGYRMAQRIREERFPELRLPAPERRAMVKEHFYMLPVDEERALETLPALLRTDAERQTAIEVAHRVLGAKGDMSAERRVRLGRVEAILGAGTATASA